MSLLQEYPRYQPKANPMKKCPIRKGRLVARPVGPADQRLTLDDSGRHSPRPNHPKQLKGD